VYDSGRTSSFGFDAAGRQTEMSDETGTTSYDYDQAGRLSSASYPGTGTLFYGYDESNNRTQMTDRDGGLTSYSYDANNRLTRLQNPLGEVTSFLYDALDRESGRVLANGVTMQRGFDGDGRIDGLRYQSAAGALLLLHTLTYDAAGNVQSVSEQDGAVTSYDYDNADQLLSETRTGAQAYSRTYSYDAAGNRLTSSDGANLTSSSYDAANQLETSQSDTALTSYQYDGAGNRISEEADGAQTSYTWNQENRLVELGLPTGEVQTMVYAGDGDLRQRRTNQGSTLYLRDGENLLQEVDAGTGQTLRHYSDLPGEWGGLISVASVQGALFNVARFNQSQFNRTPGASGASSTSRFFAFDHLGTTRLVLDGSGAVIRPLLFSGYGEELSAVDAETLFGYDGLWGYLRVAKNLMWVRARFYDAKNGVWHGFDPIGFEGGDWNLFRYVKNNSNNWIDPSGLQKDVTSQELFKRWFAGTGPSRCVFGPGSSFTEEFRRGNRFIRKEVDKAKVMLESICRDCDTCLGSNFDISFPGKFTAAGQAARDLVTGITQGGYGNLAQSFVGSAQGRWRASEVDCCRGFFYINFYLRNVTGWKSLTHFPGSKYGKPSIEENSDKFLMRPFPDVFGFVANSIPYLGSSGTLENDFFGKKGRGKTIQQELTWKEHTYFRGNPKCCKK